MGLGRFQNALESAEQLLADAKCPPHLGFYAHLYAAEALVLLGRTTEALAHLSPERVESLFAARPEAGDTDEGLQVRRRTHAGSLLAPMPPQLDADAARALLLVNMGSVYAVRGELDRAAHCVKEAETVKAPADISRRAVLLSLYIELLRGNHAEALSIVRHARQAGPV